MGTLRDVVAELNQWRADHEDVLRPLKLWEGLVFLEPLAPSSAASSSDSDSSPSQKKKAPETSSSTKPDGSNFALASIGAKCDTPHDKAKKPSGDGAAGQGTGQPKPVTKITQQSLSACLHAAEKLAVGRSLKEVREIRSVLHNATEWMDNCQTLCPRRQSKRRIQPASKPTIARLEEFIKQGLAFPVEVVEDVSRIRSHINEAENWRVTARSALERISESFAEQTQERMELWRKEEEEELSNKTALAENETNKQSSSKGNDSTAASTTARDAPNQATGTSGADSQSTAVETKKQVDSSGEDKVASVGQDGEPPDDDESDSVDREDELDELEEKDEKALDQLLTLARDISVFMPEEILMERIQRIMQWAR